MSAPSVAMRAYRASSSTSSSSSSPSSRTRAMRGGGSGSTQNVAAGASAAAAAPAPAGRPNAAALLSSAQRAPISSTRGAGAAPTGAGGNGGGAAVNLAAGGPEDVGAVCPISIPAASRTTSNRRSKSEDSGANTAGARSSEWRSPFTSPTDYAGLPVNALVYRASSPVPGQLAGAAPVPAPSTSAPTASQTSSFSIATYNSNSHDSDCGNAPPAIAPGARKYAPRTSHSDAVGKGPPPASVAHRTPPRSASSPPCLAAAAASAASSLNSSTAGSGNRSSSGSKGDGSSGVISAGSSTVRGPSGVPRSVSLLQLNGAMPRPASPMRASSIGSTAFASTHVTSSSPLSSSSTTSSSCSSSSSAASSSSSFLSSDSTSNDTAEFDDAAAAMAAEAGSGVKRNSHTPLRPHTSDTFLQQARQWHRQQQQQQQQQQRQQQQQSAIQESTTASRTAGEEQRQRLHTNVQLQRGAADACGDDSCTQEQFHSGRHDDGCACAEDIGGAAVVHDASSDCGGDDDIDDGDGCCKTLSVEIDTTDCINWKEVQDLCASMDIAGVRIEDVYLQCVSTSHDAATAEAADGGGRSNGATGNTRAIGTGQTAAVHSARAGSSASPSPPAGLLRPSPSLAASTPPSSTSKLSRSASPPCSAVLMALKFERMTLLHYPGDHHAKQLFHRAFTHDS